MKISQRQCQSYGPGNENQKHSYTKEVEIMDNSSIKRIQDILKRRDLKMK